MSTTVRVAAILLALALSGCVRPAAVDPDPALDPAWPAFASCMQAEKDRLPQGQSPSEDAATRCRDATR